MEWTGIGEETIAAAVQRDEIDNDLFSLIHFEDEERTGEHETDDEYCRRLLVVGGQDFVQGKEVVEWRI